MILTFLPNELYYTISALLAGLVLFGIYLMSKVEKARFGNIVSSLAMLFAIILTLIQYDIISVWIIYPSMAVGLLIGLYWIRNAKMIQMPQLVALYNGFGGAASAIIASFAFMGINATEDLFSKISSLLAITIGVITFFGSLVAAGKLHKILPQKPIVIPKHQLVTILLLILSLALIVLGIIDVLPSNLILYSLIVVTTLFGIIFCIRIGGADMPITISLLNSLSGVAGAIAGLALQDVLLVAIGGIVGASGLILTQIMCRAMNRNLMTILLGKTTTAKVAQIAGEERKRHSSDDPVEVLRNAKEVIIVPGYGMAIAQAQHLVKRLADVLTEKGVKVKYAVHPVAGRMPGHMNVLLSEANVDYDDLYEMDAINDEFKNVDATIVVGANDVLNPAARNMEGTPIYGMPILNVDECKHIIVFNYDLKPGYAGVENPIYDRDEGLSLILGNAADTLAEFIEKIK
ncbi:MAG TPA: NAD(P)(+) transhydrogenase (Re/Si-specific) subunit beta [Acholeplasmataceae bacterium]|nr:NAD(P)(+) transhydrogenase (Re/Si-specific) subunit beta [Acholeplasmataceae bacterium]